MFIANLFQDYCYKTGEANPYGWSGIDLDSLYRGYAREMGANLKDLGLTDDRETAHCALDDAMYLADMASELIYRRIGEWEVMK